MPCIWALYFLLSLAASVARNFAHGSTRDSRLDEVVGDAMRQCQYRRAAAQQFAEEKTLIQNPNLASPIPAALPGDISIGGPGTLDVLAGRNLNLGLAPVNPTQEAQGLGLGIVSIGNARNPFLPVGQGTTITAAAGIGGFAGASGGVADYAAFIAAFIDPATAGSEASRNLPHLATLLGAADDNSAWAEFQLLSAKQRQQLALDIFYLVLRDAGHDHNDPNAVNGTRNYEVGFRAIATLFPGPRQPGDISINEREIKTERGGDINLLAPGGQVTMGFDTTITQPLDQGITTLESGNINIFADGNVTLGSSRIFTFRGGNEIIWSSTGNIAAGNASKTEVSAPPARYLIDPQTGASIFDPGGLATGGGIGTLQTVKGAPPGNVDLIAPVGFIDADDAGIRVSGNLNLAAVAVLNAANIQVQGASTGIPTVQAPNVGALTTASNAAGASQAAMPTTTGSATNNEPSIIIVEVVGHGGGEGSDTPSKASPDGSNKPSSAPVNDKLNYNLNSPFQVLGAGALTEEQKQVLTPEEQRNLSER